MIKINEVFLSAQGEGPDSGIPTVFLRLSGCNVECKWCDSKYHTEVKETLSVEDLVKRVQDVDRYQSGRVYITGGEPLVQREFVAHLVYQLTQQKYDCTIATNGTLSTPSWWRLVTWDVDMKCPSSGVTKFEDSWVSVGRKNRVKFVVADRQDLNFVLTVLPDMKRVNAPTLLVSPMIPTVGTHTQNWLQEVWNFCVQYNLRYSLQIHKVIFGAKKGV